MLEREMKRYLELNKLAEQDGIVIFGNEEDCNIPLCELKQAFGLNSKLYNRSITGLSIHEAAEAYTACIAQLHPETVLLHIGAADVQFFSEHPKDFAQKYRELIAQIRACSKKCRIGIISLRNPDNATAIVELNRHLKYIAESERCEYSDISTKRVWNPQETKDVVSFVYSIGFVRPLTGKRPLYDLVKILFCYEPQYIA